MLNKIRESNGYALYQVAVGSFVPGGKVTYEIYNKSTDSHEYFQDVNEAMLRFFFLTDPADVMRCNILLSLTSEPLDWICIEYEKNKHYGFNSKLNLEIGLEKDDLSRMEVNGTYIDSRDLENILSAIGVIENKNKVGWLRDMVVECGFYVDKNPR